MGAEASKVKVGSRNPAQHEWSAGLKRRRRKKQRWLEASTSITGAENNEEHASVLTPHESPSVSRYITVHTLACYKQRSRCAASQRGGGGGGGGANLSSKLT